MIIQVIIGLLAILTLIGIGAWIWAFRREGAVGLMTFWTIVAAGCLIVSVVYEVHAQNNRPQAAQSKVVKPASKLKGRTYFSERAKQQTAEQKQGLKEKWVLKQLRETYRDTVGPVSFAAAKKQYVVQAKKPAYQKALAIIGNHPKQNKKALRTIRQNMNAASKVVTKSLKQDDYTLILKSGSKTLLAAQDGRILTDRLVK